MIHTHDCDYCEYSCACYSIQEKLVILIEAFKSYNQTTTGKDGEQYVLLKHLKTKVNEVISSLESING